MKLSEDTVGDPDILVSTLISNQTTTPFLNQTDIDLKLQNNSLILGTSPRWLMFGSLLNRDTPSLNTSGLILLLGKNMFKK
jgi:hypothetical protein